MTTVSVSGLVKRYGSFTALKSCDLHIESGRLVTLLGPSGCGKTTLLRSIAGITEVSAGDIHFDDRRMNDVPIERRNVGMVFQTYALFPHMTVYRNLAFGLEMKRVPKSEMPERIARALRLVALEAHADRYPRQLSGGQQQRVALARAVVIEPDVLLFDEPLSNLDARLRETLREELSRMQRALGITSIYVTHDQAEAMALADSIVVMRSGEIVERGDPETLYRRPKFRYTAEFLGNTNIIACTVESGGLRTPWGELKPSTGPLPPDGSRVMVSMRPEDVDLAAVTGRGGPSDGPRGIVRDVSFLGSEVRYVIEISGASLRCQRSGTDVATFAEGEEVEVLTPSQLHVVEDDGGVEGAPAATARPT